MSWSYSKLVDFEQCKYRYRLKHVDRVPEAKSEAADRGTAIHQMAEDFVGHKLKSLPTELLKFSDDFVALRQQHKEGMVSLEGEWGFDDKWEPTNYKTAWLRMKLDAAVYQKAHTHAIVIDYKTGRKYGNEIKHGEQVQLYAAATAIREPRIQNVTVELWYLDKNELTRQDYSREQALSFIKNFDRRAKKIEDAHKRDVFEPNPNTYTCQWCPYGAQKGGQCPHVMTSTMTLADYRKKFS